MPSRRRLDRDRKSVEPPPPLTDGAIDTLIDHTRRISPRSCTIVFQLGGALARVAEDATAYPQREGAHTMMRSWKCRGS